MKVGSNDRSAFTAISPAGNARNTHKITYCKVDLDSCIVPLRRFEFQLAGASRFIGK